MGLLVSVIAGSNQGADRCVLKSHRLGLTLEACKRIGMDIAPYRQMMTGWR
jgi:hypothetical protein